MTWLQALLLGAVQGVTEFLPISSDGHLALFQILMGGGNQETEAGRGFNLFFDVMLHLGTAAAILVHYRGPIRAGALGLLGSESVPEPYRRPRLIRVAVLVMIATAWLVPVALVFKPMLDEAFHSLWAVSAGFATTAVVLLVLTRLPGGTKGPSETTANMALLIGLAQAFAPLPGVSRSGLTIAAGLALGLSKVWAVGFSLMLAVPAILGAAVFEARKVDPSLLTGERIAQTAAAAVVAGIVGYAAILWLLRVVRSGRFWYFSVYLFAVSALAAGLAWQEGVGDDVPGQSLDRAGHLGAAGSGLGEREGRSGDGLGGADADGPSPGRGVDRPPVAVGLP